MTSHQLDLRALIHEVAAESGPDLEAVTKEVRRRIPDNAVEDALDQALPTLVYKVARTGAAPDQGSTGSHAADVRGGARKPVPSSKLAARRSYPWERELNSWVSVGVHEFKFFGDCTADDLAHVAQARFRQAEDIRVVGERMVTAREMLARYKKDRVRDLPPEALAKLFSQVPSL